MFFIHSTLENNSVHVYLQGVQTGECYILVTIGTKNVNYTSIKTM